MACVLFLGQTSAASAEMLKDYETKPTQALKSEQFFWTAKFSISCGKPII